MASEQTPFHNFIDLVAFDQGLRALHEQVEKLEQVKLDLKSQLDTFEVRKIQAKDRVHNLRKEVDLHELRMKELEAQLEEKKNYLDQVSSMKEYQSINAEINITKSEQHNLENTLVDAWNKMETAQKAYELLEKDHDEKLKKIHFLQQEAQKKIDVLEKEISSKKILRDDKEKIVPNEWVEKYSMMRMQVADPVVSVLNGSCSACFYTITEQDMQQLRRNKLLQCKECYRFLYIEQKNDDLQKQKGSLEDTVQ